MSDGSDPRRRRRIAIIVVSSFILVVIGAAVTFGVYTASVSSQASKASEKTSEVSASIKAIEGICQPTDYKEACVRSLREAGANTADPKELIKASFKAAMKHIAEAAKKSTVLKELEKTPRAQQALSNCKKLMGFAINDLERSFDKLGELEFSKLDDALADLKVWLSAVVTYQDTCLDGFQNTTGNAGHKMREALKSSEELTSNVLAMVDEISLALAKMNLTNFNRKLLSDDNVIGHGDDFSMWATSLKRKLLSKTVAKLKPNLVVAKDGSGRFRTINEALKHIPLNSKKTFVLHIKAGVYKEQVVFDEKMTNVMLVGDGPTKTWISFNKNYADGTTTFKTATVSVFGDNFIARDIGFENSAGAIKHQAVALMVRSDMAIFHNCHMDGYQDTLYAHSKRQFYRDCTITGTIDFVLGDAAAVFQNCKMLIRKPLDNQQCIVTAQGRSKRREASALILQNCTITADPSYTPFKGQILSYLGRPWKAYSRTIIMESYIDDIIQPKGWMPWLGDFGLNTCFYAEYKNRGPGASTARRVKWKGIKKITPQHAVEFTAGRFMKGDRWIRTAGVPYVAGMLNA
ncbi:putative pectinesterase/pectinesterase inhibitor 28 [Eucalyptus grandis]|uniref:putative pectinesterase/pectinesterase inhibitor 28 n=1 Tax=Eucalyptus grandis TaxID=71139 RepID=UPI00192E9F56|nr:putative pectinesterase/pectinesterase inhibitor 28 [Eucalyptus grandis]